MTERGLPIADGAPACPFVAFEDDRDERAASPDRRHRCYAEAQPAPRALAHQEAYCLSSAFPVCPTFQDWARHEAARSRDDAAKAAESGPAVTPGLPGRNPPRNWSAPPPWLSRKGKADGATDPIWGDDGDEDGEESADGDVRAEVPHRGRGLSGSYADRVASDPAAAIPGGMGADDLEDDGDADIPAPPQRDPLPARPQTPSPSSRAPGSDDDASDVAAEAPQRTRRRERDSGRVADGRPDRHGEGPAPEWERARPLEAYPTLRSRRLPELSIPPILVAVVAIALAAAVLFALPGLLGFGNTPAGASPTPAIPIRTQLPSLGPTPVPQPTLQVYLVEPGDTMSRIAGRFGVTLADLIAANTETVPDPDRLQIGQEVIIPIPLPTELPAASEIPAAS